MTYVSELPRTSTVFIEHKMETSSAANIQSEINITIIPKGTLISSGPWKTKWDLLVELRREGSNIVAIAYAVDEYGIGETSEEAMADLLTSLVDYRSWLEKREERLADKERSNLAQLRMLLEK